ncbi:putative transmembrane protein [Toxoplasma gondii MAS]|uniref:Putative transmembrane protein n=2 Tax=Toxoplasma gondii TaxID=5811 RepID=A0A2G8Y097_TOXGO|nr:putative transmembrane protein [Toxoplasma gondii MAS]PIM00701.1 putative transmembrane protein [Toxoplasma gondii COUG]
MQRLSSFPCLFSVSGRLCRGWFSFFAALPCFVVCLCLFSCVCSPLSLAVAVGRPSSARASTSLASPGMSSPVSRLGARLSLLSQTRLSRSRECKVAASTAALRRSCEQSLLRLLRSPEDQTTETRQANKKQSGSLRPPGTLFPALRLAGFIASSSSEAVTEMSLGGEWNVEVNLQLAVSELASQVYGHPGDGGTQGGAGFFRRWLSIGQKGQRKDWQRHPFFRALLEMAARKDLALTLNVNREGFLAIGRGADPLANQRHPFPPAVWQLKRQPFAALSVEIEVPFPADDPEFILVFVAPVEPGRFLPSSVRVNEGRVFVAVSPFLPWQKIEIGNFSMRPKTLKTIVDPALL